MKEEELATESKDEKRLAKTKSGKPFYKKAWFWGYCGNIRCAYW